MSASVRLHGVRGSVLLCTEVTLNTKTERKTEVPLLTRAVKIRLHTPQVYTTWSSASLYSPFVSGRKVRSIRWLSWVRPSAGHNPVAKTCPTGERMSVSQFAASHYTNTVRSIHVKRKLWQRYWHVQKEELAVQPRDPFNTMLRIPLTPCLHLYRRDNKNIFCIRLLCGSMYSVKHIQILKALPSLLLSVSEVKTFLVLHPISESFTSLQSWQCKFVYLFLFFFHPVINIMSLPGVETQYYRPLPRSKGKRG
jgi:hypothetical protein